MMDGLALLRNDDLLHRPLVKIPVSLHQCALDYQESACGFRRRLLTLNMVKRAL